jgi:hypothetical protein
MSNTSDIYSQIIIENIIKKYLEQGTVPTIEDIESEFEAVLATQDLTSSNFTVEEFSVERKEVATATKYNQTNQEVHQDINVLYKSLYDSSDRAVKLFDHWETKASGLENRLKNLESRIGRLLSLSADTNGYFETVGDKFTNTSLVDLNRSSNIAINLEQNVVTLDKPNNFNPNSTDRIFLNDLLSTQSVFNVLTRTNVIAVDQVENSEPRFAFRDTTQYWKAHVITNQKTSPVTTDLTVMIGKTISISKIDIMLHASQNNSITRITPMYSNDGINYTRLPVINAISESLEKATFSFPQTSMSYLKFIMEKDSFDFISNGQYVYEFGAKEIALFKESYPTTDYVGTLVSKPFSAIKADKTFVKFNRLTLEACEGITSETHLNYYIAVAREEDEDILWLSPTEYTAITDDRVWFPVTPVSRAESIYPKVLDLSTLNTLERTGITVSYDRTASGLVSPAAGYTLLNLVSGVPTFESEVATDQRYVFGKSSHKILDLQIDKDVPVDLNTIKIWRNVGTKGSSTGDITNVVRGVQAGWNYEAPYYTTTVQIKGNAGLSINVGKFPITIDGTSYTNVVGPDILYPFNQKLLIEGYVYPTGWEEEQLYRGVDRFAGHYLTQVSIFDMVNNVEGNDYTKFAIDLDISDTTPHGASSVFIVNVDNSIADFVNESFVIEFNLTDQLFTHLALKVEFRTDNSKLTPVLDEYSIKLGF